MKDIIFRGKRLINRVKEIEFIKRWLKCLPDEILWIYGPKSCGKTTLIEYVVENELFDDFKLFKSNKYNVKYINFRGKAIYNYESFVNSMLFIDRGTLNKKLKTKLNLGMFQIDYELYEDIKNKRIDLFDTLIDKFKESNKKNILIIDEIQVLDELYLNGEKEILKEFLNFCVRLTKELHLAHVLILSSNTIFINKIYNDAKLKVTSKFYKIDHLDYNTTKKWLIKEGFSKAKKRNKDDEIDLIWEYLGGCIPLIQRMIRDKDEFKTIKEYLDKQRQIAYSEIVMLMLKEGSEEENNIFKELAGEILKNGEIVLTSTQKSKDFMGVIENWSQKEILFFDPIELTVKGNNRLYEKGMELLLTMENQQIS